MIKYNTQLHLSADEMRYVDALTKAAGLSLDHIVKDIVTQFKTTNTPTLTVTEQEQTKLSRYRLRHPRPLQINDTINLEISLSPQTQYAWNIVEDMDVVLTKFIRQLIQSNHIRFRWTAEQLSAMNQRREDILKGHHSIDS